MEYIVINDYQIGVKDDVELGYYIEAKIIRVYDFLNMVTYLIGGNNERGGTGISVTEPQKLSDLDSLEGARLAYEELIESGGTPPEIKFPNHTEKDKNTAQDPYNLSRHRPRFPG